MAKRSSKRVSKQAGLSHAHAVASEVSSVSSSEKSQIDAHQLVQIMEDGLSTAVGKFVAPKSSNGPSNCSRDFLEATLGDKAKPSSGKFAEIIDILRDSYRAMKLFESAAAQQDWPAACLNAYLCGANLMAGERALGLRAEVIGFRAAVARMGATQAAQRLAETKRVEAETELCRRLAANPRLKKTSAIEAMAKEKKYGSRRTLQKSLKHVKQEPSVL